MPQGRVRVCVPREEGYVCALRKRTRCEHRALCVCLGKSVYLCVCLGKRAYSSICLEKRVWYVCDSGRGLRMCLPREEYLLVCVPWEEVLVCVCASERGLCVCASRRGHTRALRKNTTCGCALGIVLSVFRCLGKRLMILTEVTRPSCQFLVRASPDLTGKYMGPS